MRVTPYRKIKIPSLVTVRPRVGGRPMSIDTIYNFKRIDDRLVLGGQPSAE
jgi:hypothetical protein